MIRNGTNGKKEKMCKVAKYVIKSRKGELGIIVKKRRNGLKVEKDSTVNMEMNKRNGIKETLV